MNTQNPLLPQGTLPPKAKSNICFKIMMILAIHVVVIGGLLLQGCSKDKASTPASTEAAAATNTSPMSTTPDFAPTPAAPAGATAGATAPMSAASNTAPMAASTATPMTVSPSSALVAPLAPVTTSVATPGVAKEYVIASGDTLGAISKHNGVSIKALLEANPGVDAKKLQIGHKLQIPAGNAVASSTPASVASATASNSVADATPAVSGDTSTYTVKAGDRLLKIASAHGTTVKAILSLNEMKTTAIRAGQKLKMPVMKVASAEVAPVSTPASSHTSSAIPATTAN